MKPMQADIIELGHVEYEDGMRMQRQLVDACGQGQIGNQLLVLEHPHTFTFGRRAAEENLLIDAETRRWWQVQVHHSDRGGNITYHGPGQVVMYPILALPPSRQDVVRYVRDLEEVMLRVLADYDIEGGRSEGLAGAWVGEEKIGAIGVHLSRWVTSHGLALNVNTDLRYFGHIVPCGIRDHGVTSLQRLLGRPLDLGEVRSKLLHHFQKVFGITLHAHPLDLYTIQTLIFRRTPNLEVLIIHRNNTRDDFWQPVTGSIEAGESPARAAAREASEETGLEGKLGDLDYVADFMLDPSVLSSKKWAFPCFTRAYTFGLEVASDLEVQLDPRTHDAYKWCSPAQAIALLRWPSNQEGIRRLERCMIGPQQSDAAPSSTQGREVRL